MRIALVCPHFPPEVCGVGDYTAQVSAELARTGHEVRVWTAQPDPAPASGVEAVSRPYPWNHEAFEALVSEIGAWSPDAAVIEFTPNLYAPISYGLNPALPIFVNRLRARLRRPVLLTAHELHHPLGVKPDRLLLGTPQLAQFLSLVLSADLTLFTYEIPCRRYQRFLPWLRERLFWQPVGANVLPGPGYARRKSGDGSLLLQFGSPHPSRLFDFSIAALDLALRRSKAGSPTPRLLMLGTAPATVRTELKNLGRLDLLSSVEGMGFLEAEAISDWMGRADLVLAPYYDGISTRRGSVMAALAHGTPVVTTRGYHTDPSVRWEEFCGLASATDAREFAEKTCELLADPVQAERLGEKGRIRYETEFSWQAISRGILHVLAENAERHA